MGALRVTGYTSHIRHTSTSTVVALLDQGGSLDAVLPPSSTVSFDEGAPLAIDGDLRAHSMVASSVMVRAPSPIGEVMRALGKHHTAVFTGFLGLAPEYLGGDDAFAGGYEIELDGVYVVLEVFKTEAAAAREAAPNQARAKGPKTHVFRRNRVVALYFVSRPDGGWHTFGDPATERRTLEALHGVFGAEIAQ